MANPVVHFEIGCRDNARTRDYYSRLFGWHITEAGPAASMIDTQSTAGVQGHITSLGHEPHHYAMFYVQVDNIELALDKAVMLGGKKLVGPVKLPKGRFAWFADPDGNQVGLMEP